MDMKQQPIAEVFKALGHPQRLRLFEMIYRMGAAPAGPGERRGAKQRGANEMNCCAVERAFTHGCACVDLSRSTVSHHLAALRRAGLITCTREGRVMQCVVNPKVLEAVRGFLAT
jgi:ArsR family transcriptional regulator, arsenate/arsenite/antimonite-responsive transcriptional repressor